MISQLALIGAPPQMRGFNGPGIPPVISPDARIEAFASVDAGVTRATQIGSRSWLMKSVHVGHDVVIGEDCEIGVGVIIRPYITVGDGARLGAGAVVISDVPAGEVWVGNPARPLPPKAS